MIIAVDLTKQYEGGFLIKYIVSFDTVKGKIIHNSEYGLLSSYFNNPGNMKPSYYLFNIKIEPKSIEDLYDKIDRIIKLHCFQ